MDEISLHILDAAENCLNAGARRVVIVLEKDVENDLLKLILSDDGRGMNQEELTRAVDPFYTTRTTRKVGLGLSLLKQTAEQSGGFFSLTSNPGRGTEIKAGFGLSHLDRPPLGDMAATLLTLIVGRSDVDFYYRQITEDDEFILDTAEIKKTLDGVAFSDPEVLIFLRRYINNGAAGLSGV